MAKAKKGGGKGKKKGGKKKGGKKKGKKKLKVKIISYWDRKACPIFTGPWTFQGKTGDEAQQAFEAQAAAIREKLKFEKENTYVCLRVRQIEIDAHDFYITLPKDCPLQRLQIEICKRQHLGSVLPSDIAVYKPSKALEKNLMFGSSMAMLLNTKKEKPIERPKPKSVPLAAENDMGGMGGMDDVTMMMMMAESDSPRKPSVAPVPPPQEDEEEEEEDISDGFEYFQEASLQLKDCFPLVSPYPGGIYSFTYNPNGPSPVIVPPPEPERPVIPDPPKPKKVKEGKKGKKGGKDDEKDDKKKKKKKKKAAPKKKEKPKPPPIPVPQFIDVPTPVNVFYDIIPYITFSDVPPTGPVFSESRTSVAARDLEKDKKRAGVSFVDPVTMASNIGIKKGLEKRASTQATVTVPSPSIEKKASISATPAPTPVVDKRMSLQPTPTLERRTTSAMISQVLPSLPALPSKIPIPVVPSTLTRPQSASSSIDTRHPLLMAPEPKHVSLYGLKQLTALKPYVRPQTAPTLRRGGLDNVVGGTHASVLASADSRLGMNTVVKQKAVVGGRNVQSAGPQVKKRWATDGNRLVQPLPPPSTSRAGSRPATGASISAITANSTRFSSARTVRGDPVSMVWDKRWLSSYASHSGAYHEYGKMIPHCDPLSEYSDDSFWESDEDVTVVELEEGWEWRMRDWKPNARSVELRADAKKRIETVTPVVEDKKDKKGKKGKKGGKKGGKKKK